MNVYDLTDGHDPMTHAEIDALRDLARALPSHSLIVNIGAAGGLSTIAFLEGCPTAIIYSVDVNECPQEFENVAACGLNSTRVVRLLGRSEEIGVHFPYKCSLLFVDGGHFNAGNDTDAWLHCVESGGVVAYHDYMAEPPPNNPGCVYRDIEERGLLDKYPVISRVDRVIAFRVSG